MCNCDFYHSQISRVKLGYPVVAFRTIEKYDFFQRISDIEIAGYEEW